MSKDTTYPEPADHGRTISVDEYELAPGAKLSRASMGPVGAGEYSSFIVLDVNPDTGEINEAEDDDEQTSDGHGGHHPAGGGVTQNFSRDMPDWRKE